MNPITLKTEQLVCGHRPNRRCLIPWILCYRGEKSPRYWGAMGKAKRP